MEKEGNAIIEYIRIHVCFARITSCILKDYDKNISLALCFYFGEDQQEYVFVNLSLSNGVILQVTGKIVIIDKEVQKYIEKLGIPQKLNREYNCSDIYLMISDVSWTNLMRDNNV